MLINAPFKKIKPKDKLADWLMSVDAGQDQAWIFHDPNMTASSKHTTVCTIIRTKLHWRGYKVKVKRIIMPAELAKEKKLKYKKGYEPLLIYLLKKEKKQL